MDYVKVLVVVDEDDFRELILKRIIVNHMTAQGTKHGTIAMEILNRQEFDVVILDSGIAEEESIETLRQIKADKPEIEVIVLTGNTCVEFGIIAMKLGAFDYVIKPVVINELLDKIRQAHEKKHNRT